MISGSSAGGFGTYLNTYQLANVFGTEIKTTVIVDAGQIFMDTDILTSCLVDQWKGLWNLPVPEDINSVITKTYNYDIQKLYEYLSLKYPDFNFGFLSYYEDETNRWFYSFGKDDCKEITHDQVEGKVFKEGLLDLQNNLLVDLPNWKVFYKEGDTHTFLSSETLTQSINNTALNDWIRQLRQGTAVDLIE